MFGPLLQPARRPRASSQRSCHRLWHHLKRPGRFINKYTMAHRAAWSVGRGQSDLCIGQHRLRCCLYHCSQPTNNTFGAAHPTAIARDCGCGTFSQSFHFARLLWLDSFFLIFIILKILNFIYNFYKSKFIKIITYNYIRRNVYVYLSDYQKL